MKKLRMRCTLALALLFAAASFVQLTERLAIGQQEPEAKPEEKEKQEAPKPEKKKEKPEAPASKSSRSETENSAAQGGQAGHSHPAGKGGHIPDNKFRATFGRSHTFVVNRPVIVNNQPTFQSGGYTFIIVDAWPAGWAYTDDCYIDYIDGEYFLFDVLHPGVQITLFVEM